MVSKTLIGMSTTNIHLLPFKIQSHLQKRELNMQVHLNLYRRKTRVKFLTLQYIRH